MRLADLTAGTSGPGGIGRHARLRIWCLVRVGSSPTIPTSVLKFNLKGEQLNDYSSIDLYLSKRTRI